MNQAEWSDEVDRALDTVHLQLLSLDRAGSTSTPMWGDALIALIQELDRSNEVGELDDAIAVRMAAGVAESLNHGGARVRQRDTDASSKPRRLFRDAQGRMTPVTVSVVAMVAAAVLLGILFSVFGLRGAGAPGTGRSTIEAPPSCC